MRLGLCMTLWLVTGATAQERGPVPEHLLVVLSNRHKAYEQAAQGLLAELARQRRKANVVTLDELRANLVRNPDALRQPTPTLVYCVGTQAAAFVVQRRELVAPLVYCMVSDPELSGLRGSRRIHGVGLQPSITEQFAFIHRALPRLRRIGMLYDGRTEKGRATVAAARAACPKGTQLLAIDVATSASRADAIAAVTRNVDVVWTNPDRLYDRSTLQALLLRSIRQGTPVFGFQPELVAAGCLLGYRVHPSVQGEQAAALTDSVLAQPGPDRPAPKQSIFVDPRFELLVNPESAKTLGIRLPANLLQTSTGARPQ